MELLARRAGRPLISAHRGFAAVAPENTLAALELAWRAGATVAEIDVQLTRDGHVVLMHDRSVARTTNGSG
ncbi:MAG: glycerophosphodiester phosphodiesterase, partial [Methanobacteriota archaeon]